MDLRQERIFHVPTPGDLDRPVGPTGVFLRMAEEGEVRGYVCYSQHLGREHDEDAFEALVAEVDRFRPTIVLWQHPGQHEVPRGLLQRIKGTSSRPVLGYDEKDPYLLVRKRLERGGRALAREAHRVFLTGAGVLRSRFRLAGARNISYSPSEADLARFDEPAPIEGERAHQVVMIANRVRPTRRWLPLEPLPGIRHRVRLAEELSDVLGDGFALYGEGWEDLPSARGPIPFHQQTEIARNAWITIGWDHHDVPYNFSNRLPIMLLSGVAHVTNRQAGYDSLFRDGEHLFMAESVEGAVALVRHLLDGERDRLAEVGSAGREWTRAHYSTEVVYRRQIEELAVLRAEGGR